MTATEKMENLPPWSELSAIIELSVTKAVKASVSEAMLLVQMEVNRLTNQVALLDDKLTVLDNNFRESKINQASQITGHEKQLTKIASQAASDSILLDHQTGTIAKLEQDIIQLKNKVRKHLQITNDLEQKSRALNLRISGLKVQPHTSTQEVVSFCRDKLNIHDIQNNDILRVSIISKKTTLPNAESQSSHTNIHTSPKPNIIITFANIAVRDKILQNRRNLKGTHMGITEDLTPINSQFLKNNRSDPRIVAIWSWKGKLFCTLRNSNKKMIIDPTIPLDEQLSAPVPINSI